MGAPSRHRSNILNAAVTLFRRRGYAATGLADILQLSGAPKGSLYHYFPQGKEQLGEEAALLADFPPGNPAVTVNVPPVSVNIPDPLPVTIPALTVTPA